jgi:hypothetical protein
MFAFRITPVILLPRLIYAAQSVCGNRRGMVEKLHAAYGHMNTFRSHHEAVLRLSSLGRLGPTRRLEIASGNTWQLRQPCAKFRTSGGAEQIRSTTAGGFKRFIQTPAMMVILNEDLTYRPIHMDGRALEANPNPSWMGYSVGHWDGDTLVVESNGFNDQTWLMGYRPHTESLRITERFRRPDFGHLEVAVTFQEFRGLQQGLDRSDPFAICCRHGADGIGLR